MVDAAMGVSKPRTRHAVRSEASRNAGPSFRMCRRAREPRRGSIVRHADLRVGGTVRGCCDGPLKESESARGAPVRRKPAREARPRECPEGVETPCGSDGTHSRPSGVGSVSPERRATPREGRAFAARRSLGSPHRSSLWRAERTLRPFLRQASSARSLRKQGPGPFCSWDPCGRGGRARRLGPCRARARSRRLQARRSRAQRVPLAKGEGVRIGRGANPAVRDRLLRGPSPAHPTARGRLSRKSSPIGSRSSAARRLAEEPFLDPLLRAARGGRRSRCRRGCGRRSAARQRQSPPKHVPRIPIEGFPAARPHPAVRAGPRPRPSCRAASAPRATCGGRGPR